MADEHAKQARQQPPPPQAPVPETSAGWAAATEGAVADGRQFSPSAARNIGPIIEVLQRILPSSGAMLEVASGTGQHITAYAERFPHLCWQPSDADEVARESITAWRAHSGRSNLNAPIALDLLDPDWDRTLETPVAGIIACNLLHISPFAVTENLIAGAARLLPAGGPLFVYGCFSRQGDFVAPSNTAFDHSLRRQDPRWGVRDTTDVDALARTAGFAPAEIVAMPANNTVMIWRRV